MIQKKNEGECKFGSKDSLKKCKGDILVKCASQCNNSDSGELVIETCRKGNPNQIFSIDKVNNKVTNGENEFNLSSSCFYRGAEMRAFLKELKTKGMSEEEIYNKYYNCNIVGVKTLQGIESSFNLTKS